MLLEEDIAALDADILDAVGEVVTYTPTAGGEAVQIDALFEAPGQPISKGDIMFESTGPQVRVNKTDVPLRAHGDLIARANGETFKVVEILEDEGGLVLFRLRVH